MNIVYLMDNVNVYKKYGLILTSKTIEPAEPRLLFVDVPGRDGLLDITDTIGGIKYKNRKIILNFSMIGNHLQNMRVFGQFSNDFNGRKVFPSFSEDIDYYYDARVEKITFEQTSNNVAEVTMTITAFPYAQTKEDFEAKSEDSIDDVEIVCSRMPTVPTIIIEQGSADITFEGKTYHLEQGTYAIQTIVMHEGINTFHVEGNEVVFKYKKGKL